VARKSNKPKEVVVVEEAVETLAPVESAHVVNAEVAHEEVNTSLSIKEEVVVEKAPKVKEPVAAEKEHHKHHFHDVVDRNAFYLFPKEDWDAGKNSSSRQMFKFKTAQEGKEFVYKHKLDYRSGYAMLQGDDLIKQYQFVLMNIRNKAKDDRKPTTLN